MIGDVGKIPSRQLAYDEAFILRYKVSGLPVQRRCYRITLETGEVVVGRTDGEGRTLLIESDAPQVLHIEVMMDERLGPLLSK